MNIRAISIIVLGAGLFMAAGCQKPQSNAWDKIRVMEDERIKLTRQVRVLKDKNKQLSRQVETLTKFDHELRLEMISNLERIAIDKRSGFFDKDDDGTDETLIVYVKTYDDAGDVVKAAGEINIQLWDLTSDPKEALLGEWDVKAKELKVLWMGMMMTDYYRLPYKIPELLNDRQTELTLKVKFTDYLTGKIFEEQKVLKR